MAPTLIVLHGGSWNNNIYEGGTKDYIPIPPGGFSFNVLLSKLEVRMNKDQTLHTFDIEAIVKDPGGENYRMKVTDTFELSHLMGMVELPTVYVRATPKSNFPCTLNSTFGDVGVVPPLNTTCESTSTYTPTSSSWIIPGFNKQASINHDEISMQMEPLVTGEIVHDAVFRNKDSMLSAIHAYHLKNSVQFRTLKSDLDRYVIICKFPTYCSFLLRSKALGKAWKITIFEAHTCAKDMRKCNETNASSRSIAEYVGPNMTEDAFRVRPCDIQGQVLRNFGLKVTYKTALNGRNRALKTMYGDHDESFQMLAKYLYMVEQLNPGSVVALQTCDNSKFQYCFLCLSASIRAFRACRPVLVIDATHLKGKFNGVLFVATTKDANEQIVPLAFGIGDKEEGESWTWFLKNLRNSLGTPENLLIVSDQHRSIKNAVESVYPGTPHGFCTYHIQGNLKTSAGWKDDAIVTFHAAAKAYTVNDFEEQMQNLKVVSPSGYARLMDIDPIRWASCMCPVRRFSFGTSNAVECLNSRLKWGRKLPVTALLEYVRALLQSWFYERRTKATERDNEVSEYAEKRLELAIQKGNSYNVMPITSFKFHILSGTVSNVVDLNKMECTCKVFQMDLLPCSHAAAAIRYKKETPLAYVHACYSTNAWREIYADEIMPLPNPSNWVIPIDIESRFVGTPDNTRQAGRPKKKRFPSGLPVNECPRTDPVDELSQNEASVNEADPQKKERVCARCHKPGHYSTTCTVSIQVTPQCEPELKRKRNPKRCSACGFAGHTRPTCKEPVPLE